MKFIIRNTEVQIDESDHHILAAHNWGISRKGYVERGERRGGVYRKIMFHRVVTGAAVGQYVDHINGDKADNRKENLRICTTGQNSRNQKKRSGTSNYKGVCYYPNNGKWLARICYNYKRFFLGYFDNEEEAAKAYDVAAVKYYGEFAKLNIKVD